MQPNLSLLPEAVIDDFRKTIWTYYEENRRSYPWRETHDPYAVLVSEIMLQQTQTDRVVPKYEAFLTRFPTFAVLAEAPVADVLVLWQGLGYNRRALALKRAAEAVTHEHGGKLPDTLEDLMALPGIGPYTAAAVMAFAFEKPVVVLETNIRRIYLHHFFADSTDVKDKELLPIIEQTMDASRPRDWYYALMDYGSALPKRVTNPNRRSAHYTRQSKFEGSRRQVRGRILRQLVEHSPQPVSVLAAKIERDLKLVEDCLIEMGREGFVTLEGEQVYLAGK